MQKFVSYHQDTQAIQPPQTYDCLGNMPIYLATFKNFFFVYYMLLLLNVNI